MFLCQKDKPVLSSMSPRHNPTQNNPTHMKHIPDYGKYSIGKTADLPANDPIHANPNALPFYIYDTIDGYLVDTVATEAKAMAKVLEWCEDDELMGDF